ncbi:MAG TPA: hypothetical protein VFU82_05720 [Gammaproteobacteria bacterium]|nr:hypothetical protein [Gammaproteobacteria bacterium]
MPNQAARKKYCNLLDLLEGTASYTPEEFSAYFQSASPSGVIYSETINDCLPYLMQNKKHSVYPLQFAISRSLFNRIQFLYEHGATNDIRGFQAFKYLVAMNAPLSLLQYCMENKKYHDDEKYPALLAVFDNPGDRQLEKFEAIHEHCFGLRFENILLGLRPDEMSQADFDKAIDAYSQEVDRCALLKNRLKSIYLDIIKHNRNYKSHLKIDLVFGKENPVVNFLKTNHDSIIQDTKEFQQLQTILKDHTLREDDVAKMRLQLDANEKRNQALAGLYFAYYDFSEKADYELFKKHLVLKKETLDQAAERNFERLLKNYLNDKEMKKLKINCLSALENSRAIRGLFSEEISKSLARKSPMRTIIRTGTTTRKEKETGTLKKAMKFCLFGKALNQPRQRPQEYQGPEEQPDYLNVPSAYSPEYVQP